MRRWVQNLSPGNRKSRLARDAEVALRRWQARRAASEETDHALRERARPGGSPVNPSTGARSDARELTFRVQARMASSTHQTHPPSSPCPQCSSGKTSPTGGVAGLPQVAPSYGML